jgi:hypothetical protein
MATNYDDALKFANEFCDKFDIEMNNGQMARFVDLLVAFREAAQQGVQSDVCPVCRGEKVVGRYSNRPCLACNGTGKRR